MILVTGDLHGLIDWPDRPAMGLERLTPALCPAMAQMGEGDFLLVAGDFGYQTNRFAQNRQQFLDWFAAQPYTTLFVDGNHDNFDALDALPLTEAWGGKVHRIHQKLYHLPRGEVYTLPDETGPVTLLAFGGANSVDKAYQQAQGTWWAREMPGPQEYENARRNLARVGGQVDLILTHTAPYEITRMFYRDMVYRYLLRSVLAGDPIPEAEQGEIPLNRFLHELSETVSFRRWYMGHIHEDVDDLSLPDEAGQRCLIFTQVRNALTGECLTDDGRPRPAGAFV